MKSTCWAAIALALAMAAAAGCATETRSYRIEPPGGQAPSWNGRAIDDVIATWGAPRERQPDGEGGQILVYEEKTPISTSVTEGGKAPDLDPSVSGNDTKTQRITRVRAKFWLNPQGVVYRTWFSTDAYEKGDNEPPSRKQPE